ncbi:XTP/dITP diphosphatase [Dethiosulfatarculus sandiegensis]|uniref:dITP/XTP pyrophosphatase n=1 Tax=Dethiosulfatarculus sandiegensis TaxID=1429043 RepID=A0A0D2J4Y7_9BACT|nr:XTP/dITP diphosphatase [Dethiosulfatarculus sandiegensis]KIX13199.1 deoxyribonucleotide triphosphate pyrophosphatase [Dethiosulfatarculus sandiegensis]
MKLVLASTNKGKRREIEAMAAPLGIEVLLMSELGFDREIEETGDTFEENALLKARTVAAELGLPVLADDSGLEVYHLGNRPGVKSARYAGENATDKENNQKLAREMEGVPLEKRGAAFECCMVCALPDGRFLTAHGRMEGRIALKPHGENGFGYDPWFELPDKGVTVAQLPAQEKNAISHRAQALQKIVPGLKEFIAS